MQINESNNIEYPPPAGINQNIEAIEAAVNPTPDNPPWNSLTAFGFWVISVVLLIMLPNIFLGIYLLKANVALSSAQEILEFTKTDVTANILLLLSVIPAHVLTLFLAWLLVTKLRKFSFRQTLGWKSGGFVWWYYPLILIGIFIVSAITLYFIPEQDNDFLRVLRSSHTATYIAAFLATFTAPLVEEVIYRGVLYSAFQRTFGITLAIVFVTIIFASVHFPQYWGSPSTLFLICFLSLTLTLVRVYSKNLLPCIILHTLINGIQAFFLVLQTFLPDLNAVQNKAATIIYWLK